MIKSRALQNRINGADDVCYWFDYLKINLKTKLHWLSEILHLLDCDNSADYMIEMIHNDVLYNITYHKIRTALGDCLKIQISIDDYVQNIGQYLEYTEHNQKIFQSVWSVDLYWSYIQLVRIWKIWFDFFDCMLWIVWCSEDIETYRTWKFSRADYKIDLCYKEEKIETIKARSILKIRSNWNLQNKIILHEYQKWDIITNWSYWSKSSKYVFIRCYDKLLDTEKKKKHILYLDFLQYKTVTRLEIECRNKFLSARSDGYCINTIDQLEIQCLEYLGMQEKTWNFKKDYWNATQYEFYDDLKKTLYNKKTLSQARTIKKNWLDPVLMLIEDLYDNWYSNDSIFWWLLKKWLVGKCKDVIYVINRSIHKM